MATPEPESGDSLNYRRSEVVDSLEGRATEHEIVKRVKKRGNGEGITGLICHNCRQRSSLHVTCSRCPLRLCERCLLNRHGEQIELERRENARWVCPRCRGGCGPGCHKTCCNCGPCRKAKGLQPTGLLLPTAREAGFSNVHDYLVHLETGESAGAIASRKCGRGWTSTDGSFPTEIVAVETAKEPDALSLTEKRTSKKRRSKRFVLVNSSWGSPIIPGYNELDVHEWRLVICGVGASWEVGQKLRSKLPTFSTEGQQVFTREEILESWEIGLDLQIGSSSDSQTDEVPDAPNNFEDTWW